jgi:hypothetical protein
LGNNAKGRGKNIAMGRGSRRLLAETRAGEGIKQFPEKIPRKALPADDVKQRFLPDSRRRNPDRYSAKQREKDPYIPSLRRIEKGKENAQDARRAGASVKRFRWCRKGWRSTGAGMDLEILGSCSEATGLAAS